jgi:hypothetical protein
MKRRKSENQNRGNTLKSIVRLRKEIKMKNLMKLVGIGSLLLLLVLPSIAMAEIKIDWDTMTATDSETGFVFGPGYMRLYFFDGVSYVEFIHIPYGYDGFLDLQLFLVHW